MTPIFSGWPFCIHYWYGLWNLLYHLLLLPKVFDGLISVFFILITFVWYWLAPLLQMFIVWYFLRFPSNKLESYHSVARAALSFSFVVTECKSAPVSIYGRSDGRQHTSIGVRLYYLLPVSTILLSSQGWFHSCCSSCRRWGHLLNILRNLSWFAWPTFFQILYLRKKGLWGADNFPSCSDHPFWRQVSILIFSIQLAIFLLWCRRWILRRLDELVLRHQSSSFLWG